MKQCVAEEEEALLEAAVLHALADFAGRLPSGCGLGMWNHRTSQYRWVCACGWS